MDLKSIARAAVHPSIGIARVGDSPEKYYLGPEVPWGGPPPQGGYKDSKGRLKRQAARFRVYGYDADGRCLGEIEPGSGVSLEWTVEVANLKAAWYDFVLAMDIPEARAAPRRNPSFVGDDREKLMIRPSPVTISGKEKSGPKYRFDDGEFVGRPVYLGELRTDKEGRLLFLGGHGKSGSIGGSPVYTFANNEGWHDDVSDGPVRAKLRIEGEAIPVDPGWVVTAPPNYGTDLKSIVTLYDLLCQVMIEGGWRDAPEEVSFREHILPIFERMSRLQWVNKGLFTQFGWDGPQDLTEPSYLKRLACNSSEYAELRRQVFNSFRSPTFADRQRLAWPWIYGDAMNVPADSNRQWLALPPFMYEMLAKWRDGDFVEDLDEKPDRPDTLEKAGPREQPSLLDKASLDFCLADAFHPGCEVTWPIRHISMFMDAFRLLPRPAQEPEPDYGEILLPEEVFVNTSANPTALYGAGTPGGPLYGQLPGGLTRWMAVPWQTDTASCRDGYEKAYDEYVPTFWPARVPNQVLSQKDYETAVDPRKPKEKRLAAFNNREEWLRFKGNYFQQIRAMVDEFGKLGVVEERPGAKDGIELPKVMYVESELGLPAGQKADLDKSQLCHVEKASLLKKE